MLSLDMDRIIICIFFLTAIFQAQLCTADSEYDGFGYDEGDPNGPHHWPERYKACAGKYQSPIDIEESLVTRVSLAPLDTTGFNSLPDSVSITNNGHTVMVTMNTTKEITISGGPLLAPQYKFAQFHFHWGMNDSLGSEDLINNRSYPMELHMVFYNADYDDAATAQHHVDGLVVLASFFEISKEDNLAYSKIVDSLSRIYQPHTTLTTNSTFTLSSLLPKNRDNYFTYTGSLTTPPCTEGVRWIDFKHPVHLSHKQMEEFRKLHSISGVVLTHNFRPIQPLSSRPVWYHSGPSLNDEHSDHKNGSNVGRISLILFVFTIIFSSYL